MSNLYLQQRWENQLLWANAHAASTDKPLAVGYSLSVGYQHKKKGFVTYIDLQAKHVSGRGGGSTAGNRVLLQLAS